MDQEAKKGGFIFRKVIETNEEFKKESCIFQHENEEQVTTTHHHSLQSALHPSINNPSVGHGVYSGLLDRLGWRDIQDSALHSLIRNMN